MMPVRKTNPNHDFKEVVRIYDHFKVGFSYYCVMIFIHLHSFSFSYPLVVLYDDAVVVVLPQSYCRSVVGIETKEW